MFQKEAKREEKSVEERGEIGRKDKNFVTRYDGLYRLHRQRDLHMEDR